MEVLRRNERGHRSTISKHLTRTTLPTRRGHTHTHARAHTHTHTGWKTRALYSPRIYVYTPVNECSLRDSRSTLLRVSTTLCLLSRACTRYPPRGRSDRRKKIGGKEKGKKRRWRRKDISSPYIVYIVSRPTRVRFRLSSRFLSSPPPSRVLSSAKRAEAEPEGKAAAAKRLSIRVKARPSSEAGRRNRGRGRGRGYRSGGRNVVPNRGENIGCLQRGERERERGRTGRVLAEC